VTDFERGTSKDPFRLVGEHPELILPFMMGADIRKPPWGIAPIPQELTSKEKEDNYRAYILSVPRVSWLWPASFFKAADSGRPASATYAGQPLHLAYDGHGTAMVSEWYKSNPAYFVATPVTSLAPLALQSGDVVIFNGHSLIATGSGDEVTHMWWNRTQQRYMWYHNGDTDPGATMDKDYGVTRDSLSDLVARWGSYRVAGVGFWKQPTHYRLREEYRGLGDFDYLKLR
jgi:hypothetical protein